ncbi:hypothetical protein N7471_003701 [Penicillium samsonianum]|uniref:uncharacterized protein n=1 Tax=Penicillium samsonianum TaxID=1882272 RepID=UPI0025472243|nr:uncharacterized protein N7471_003701 [Penicillium samsonianum]KAJ6137215.1 hypothetical protein N7471_003701 [Penicillium samsonianum]
MAGCSLEVEGYATLPANSQILVTRSSSPGVPPSPVTVTRAKDTGNHTTKGLYVTVEEAIRIIQQFRSSYWHKDRQVLWSGMLRENAQKWADEHEMQTLTTAMGPN